MKISEGTNYRPAGLDYFLSGLSSGLAAWSAGMAVSASLVADLLFAGVVLGTFLSWAVGHWLAPSVAAKLQAIPYTILILVAAIFASQFSAALPDNPFVARELAVSSMLCWMLVLGSFALFSEGTLLFQAVPSIALFGVVGSYGTFQPATYFFFGFMLCFATLFSRSHARSMLRQASAAGYGSRLLGDGIKTAPTFNELLAGPWRWAAGPGWALASAGIVILLSFLGAPMIQASVKNVSGVVKVNMPIQPSKGLSRLLDTSAEQTRVGLGPSKLSEEPILRVTLDQPRYLRAAVFQRYTGRGWQALSAYQYRNASEGLAPEGRAAVRKIKQPLVVPFTVEVIPKAIQIVPAPGEVSEVQPAHDVVMRMDATLTFAERERHPTIEGRSIVSAATDPPRDAVRDLRPGSEVLTSTDGVSAEVQQLAIETARGKQTDFDRAMAIKHEIERRAKYNLNATAAPTDMDPVDYFLFDSHEGYCDLFASSMVLMARSIGIPARYVTGYFPIHGETDGSHRIIIREDEGHAWAELFFEGHGWVVFDATEGADSVPGGERGGSSGSSAFFGGIAERGLDILIGVLVLGSLILVLRGALQKKPVEQVRRTALDREYLRFARALSAVSGQRRHLHETPHEYLEGMRESLGEQYEPAANLTSKFESSFYSQNGPDETTLTALRAEAAKLRAALRKMPRRRVARA